MKLVADIGGTTLRIAGSVDGKTLLTPKILKTPPLYDDGLKLFLASAREIARNEALESVCVGLPGVLNTSKEKLISAPHLPHWVGKALTHDLSAINAPVFLENDAALVGLGEAHFGAGRGEKIVAYITVSTGVGGVRIVDGRVDQSTSGFEPGHQILMVNGRPEELENLISGTAMEKRYGKKPEEITDKHIWNKCAETFGIGLANTILHWSPGVVVLGGSMFKEVGIPRERVEWEVQSLIKVFEVLPKIKLAELGDIGGLWGGLIYASQK